MGAAGRASDPEVMMSIRITAVLTCGLLLFAAACTDSEPTAPPDGAPTSDVALFGKPAPVPHAYAIVYAGAMTWSQAEAAAEELAPIDGKDPHLATFASEEEQNTAIAGVTSGQACWIGLHQRKSRTLEKGWTWVTHEKVSWTDWAPGQPDDKDSSENGEENVVLMLFGPEASTWWDMKGDVLYPCMIVEYE